MSTVLRACEHRVADRYCTRRIYLIIMSDTIISEKPPPSICRPPTTHTHTTIVLYADLKAITNRYLFSFVSGKF